MSSEAGQASRAPTGRELARGEFAANELFPTFEEARDVEWVRAEGKYNMVLERNLVVQRLFDAGAHAGVVWFERCREEEVSPMLVWDVARLEAHYGPQDRWVTPELDKQYKLACLDSAMARIRAQVAELEAGVAVSPSSRTVQLAAVK